MILKLYISGSREVPDDELGIQRERRGGDRRAANGGGPAAIDDDRGYGSHYRLIDWDTVVSACDYGWDIAGIAVIRKGY